MKKKNGVKIIQTAGYNGARTVTKSNYLMPGKINELRNSPEIGTAN